MKFFTRAFFGLFLLSVFLFSGNTKVLAAIPQNSVEVTNAVIKDIKSLDSSGTWYKIDLEMNSGLKFGISNIPSGWKYNYALYKGSELSADNTAALLSASNLNSQVTRCWRVTGSDSYYLKIWSTNTFSTTNPMKISFGVLPSDANELIQDNDTWQNATPLTEKEIKDFTLNGENDIDWLKISGVKKGQAIQFNFTNIKNVQSLDYNYGVYAESELNLGNEELLLGNSTPWETSNASNSYRVNADDTYYIKVWQRNNNWTTLPVKIVFKFIPPDANELIQDNDTWRNATPLTEQEIKEFTLNGENDIDWLKISGVKKGQAIQFNFTNIKNVQSLDYNYGVYAESELNLGNEELLLGNSTPWETSNASNSYRVNADDTYYIKVWQRNNNWTTLPVKIVFKFIAPDANEIDQDNDTWQNATPLIEKEIKDFTLNGENDIDWLKINGVKKGQAIQFNFTNIKNVQSLDYNYGVYAESELNLGNEKLLLGNSTPWETSNASNSYRVNADDTYYIKVWQRNNNWTILPVKIAFQFIAPDANEIDQDNDTWQNATPLTEKEIKDFTLNGENDIDWLKISGVKKGQAIQFNFTNIYNLDYNYGVYAESELNLGNEKLLLGNSSPWETSNASRSYRVNADDTYYLKVWQRNNNWTTQPIKVAFKFLPPDANEIIQDNDTWENATSLTRNVLKPFTFNGENDVDWFQVDVGQGENLPINFVGINNRCTYNFGIFSKVDLEAGKITQLFGSSNISSDKSFDYTINTPGPYYIKVWPSSTKWLEVAAQISVGEFQTVTGITLNNSALTIVEGESTTLIATVLPDLATVKDIIWESNIPSLVSVDQNGKIAGLTVGTAKITVTTINGGKQATCTVTVSQQTVPVTVVTINAPTLTVDVGASLDLSVTVLPEDASNKNVTWATSDDTVATVSQTGKVTGIKSGTADITVTSEQGAKTASCTITVNPDVVNGDTVKPIITLNGQSEVTVQVGVSYTDAGATAIDNVDGDITHKLDIDNQVNTSNIGTYIIHYNVKDMNGNQAVEVTRTVHVVTSTVTAYTAKPLVSVGIHNTDDKCAGIFVGVEDIRDASGNLIQNPDIAGYQIELKYDPTKVTVLDVIGETELGHFTANIDPVVGTVYIVDSAEQGNIDYSKLFFVSIALKGKAHDVVSIFVNYSKISDTDAREIQVSEIARLDFRRGNIFNEAIITEPSVKDAIAGLQYLSNHRVAGNEIGNINLINMASIKTPEVGSKVIKPNVMDVIVLLQYFVRSRDAHYQPIVTS